MKKRYMVIPFEDFNAMVSLNEKYPQFNDIFAFIGDSNFDVYLLMEGDKIVETTNSLDFNRVKDWRKNYTQRSLINYIHNILQKIDPAKEVKDMNIPFKFYVEVNEYQLKEVSKAFEVNHCRFDNDTLFLYFYSGRLDGWNPRPSSIRNEYERMDFDMFRTKFLKTSDKMTYEEALRWMIDGNIVYIGTDGTYMKYENRMINIYSHKGMHLNTMYRIEKDSILDGSGYFKNPPVKKYTKHQLEKILGHKFILVD